IEALWARYCERMMVDGTRIALSDWRAHVFAHPIRGPLTSRIVLLADGVSFRATPDGLVDAAGARLELADTTPVGVAHPVELAPGWSIPAQPFMQLARTVRRLSASQAASNVIREFHQFDRDWL